MIVIDTHIWLWWLLDESKLSAEQADALRREQQAIVLCTVSLLEAARKAEVGELRLPVDAATWIDDAAHVARLRMMPITPQIAVESVRLPAPFHRDPADRPIVATARVLQCPLVSSDRRIVDYPHVTTIA